MSDIVTRYRCHNVEQLKGIIEDLIDNGRVDGLLVSKDQQVLWWRMDECDREVIFKEIASSKSGSMTVDRFQERIIQLAFDC